MRLVLGALVVLLAAACDAGGALATPTPVASRLPLVELKYAVFDQVGRPWYCDPDQFPVARADEATLARQHMADMQSDAATYAAILRHNGLAPGVTLTDQQLLNVYHDWKDLQRLSLDQAGFQGLYAFSELVRPTQPSKTGGDKVEGRVDAAGKVTVVSRAPGGPLNCPICLASSTRIATPRGDVLVTDLRVGDVVRTADATGAHRRADPRDRQHGRAGRSRRARDDARGWPLSYGVARSSDCLRPRSRRPRRRGSPRRLAGRRDRAAPLRRPHI